MTSSRWAVYLRTYYYSTASTQGKKDGGEACFGFQLPSGRARYGLLIGVHPMLAHFESKA